MSLNDCLKEIRRQHGYLTPELVKETARDESHPLHKRIFDCPPEVASERYYTARAEDLIRRFKLKYKDATETEPAAYTRYWVAPRSESEPNRYEPVEEVVRDPLLSRLMSRQMKQEWLAFKRKWEHYEGFRELVQGEIEEKAS